MLPTMRVAIANLPLDSEDLPDDPFKARLLLKMRDEEAAKGVELTSAFDDPDVVVVDAQAFSALERHEYMQRYLAARAAAADADASSEERAEARKRLASGEARRADVTAELGHVPVPPGAPVLMSGHFKIIEDLHKWFEQADLRHLAPPLGPTPTDAALRRLNMIAKQQPVTLEACLPDAPPAKSWKIRRSDEVLFAADVLRDELRAQKVRTRICDAGALTLEELLKNALYDAPVDDGLHRHYGKTRTQRVELREDEHIEFRLVQNAKAFAIAVKDPFGSLPWRTITQYLGRCFRGAPKREVQSLAEATYRKRASIPPDTVLSTYSGGAGLGLYFSFMHATHLVFNLYPGVATEVIAVFAKPRSFREFALMPKSLDVFVGD